MATQRVICGDARAVLATLPERSVHVCVTSPPYLGLRDYGIAPSVWGGDEGCEHEWGEEIMAFSGGGYSDTSTLEGFTNAATKGRRIYESEKKVVHGFCRRCTAWRGCLGLEPSLDLYVAHIVEVFRAVKRVLRDDGTLWLNLGDSYATSGGPGTQGSTGQRATRTFTADGRLKRRQDGIKPKDCFGVPWAVAFALRADGWYLRSEIIWHKRSCMPESVTDRPTRAHEQVFLLSKKATYFYDNIAVAEESTGHDQGTKGAADDQKWLESYFGDQRIRHGKGATSLHTKGTTRNCRSVWTLGPEPFSGAALGGTSRITSPDCPVHGCLDDPAPARSGGEPRAVFGSDHNRHTDGRPARGRVPVAVAIPEGQSSFLSDASAATPHSSGIHRTGDGLGQGETSADIPAGRIGYTESPPRSLGADGRTTESSTSAGFASDAPGSDPEGQTSGRTADTEIRPAVAWDGGQPDDEPRTASSSTSADSAPGASSPSGRTEIGSRDKSRCSCRIVTQDHYAVYPTEIPRRAILAGTSERGCCPACGAGWRRATGRRCNECDELVPTQAKSCPGCGHVRDWKVGRTARPEMMSTDWSTPGIGTPRLPGGFVNGTESSSWSPGCECEAGEPIPATVLDPFLGSGTTLLAADRLGRNGIGVELNEAYANMARTRICGDAPLFADVV